jgi:hypothetical protein
MIEGGISDRSRKAELGCGLRYGFECWGIGLVGWVLWERFRVRQVLRLFRPVTHYVLWHDFACLKYCLASYCFNPLSSRSLFTETKATFLLLLLLCSFFVRTIPVADPLGNRLALLFLLNHFDVGRVRISGGWDLSTWLPFLFLLQIFNRFGQAVLHVVSSPRFMFFIETF